MSGAAFLARFCRDQRGSAAEFALVLPLIVLFLVGIIDAGRYAYDFNRGEKASQVGARFAVVTDPLVQELATYSFSGQTVGGVQLGQGDRIPVDALGTISCTSTQCQCVSGTCLGGNLSIDATAFATLADRIQDFWPEVADEDITVEYTGSGLGFAGNPNGMDVSPFVTVRLTNMEFTSILLFGSTVDFPGFDYTLTMEDGAGTVSN
ncbi:TadE/TadG family type IV pilus assembly protein [Qipengyuania sp. XHP0211]|uniref:TadE/TadG family type IV pilus assembly protein n=1 Tax=Qipengyuania sp. XHP0211 TaxID=3038079 RepID=UPI00241FCAF3|nr:TadE/TadG family type IV pilus assembly protein [Qipengyuania sp. XHP0211]MDG5752293.1 TadE/TadG family type IV pilus assembly protein [Qipengyuania sp. XHP0211]